jgi:superfamily II DNA/RNA helicase
VELHGNLAQNARSRNLLAFSSGTVRTLVATDISARGIHIDDVNLVIHADPPVEHKAYLHRSGRTARAGATGTVITLMTDDQAGEVRALTRSAGVTPATTRLGPGHPLLRELAPGQRSFVAPPAASPATPVAARKQPEGVPAQRGQTGRGGSTRHRARPTRAHSPHAAAVPSAGERGGSGTAGAPDRQGGAAAFSARSRVGARRGR